MRIWQSAIGSSIRFQENSIFMRVSFNFSGELVFRAGVGLPEDVAELWGELLGNFTAHKLTLRVEPDVSLPAYAVCIDRAEAVLPDEDVYCVTVNETGVSLGAKDLNGLRYAFYTFLQMLERRGDETITDFAVPYSFISDAPVMCFRGVHVCIFSRYGTSFD